MSAHDALRYRVLRAAGRSITRLAAMLTLGEMPPFVSASAIVQRDDQLLVVVDPLRREPILPGGHLKWSESPHEAVVREVREETGYLVEPGRLVGVYSGAQWAGELGVVRVIYHAELRGGHLASSSEGEACWLPAREIAGSATRDAPIVLHWLETRDDD